MSLDKINISNNIEERLKIDLPEFVIQSKNIGSSSLSYVSGATVTDLLNSIFGPLNWDFYVVEQFIQESCPFFQKTNRSFTPRPEQIAYNNKNEEGAWLDQGSVAWVKAKLVVRTVDSNGNIYTTVKESYGSKAIIGKQSEQEHIFKSAQTDALKKAASLLGIGLQLYRGPESEKFYECINQKVYWTDEMKEKSELWKKLLDVMEDKNYSFDDINEFLLDLGYKNVDCINEDILSNLIIELENM